MCRSAFMAFCLALVPTMARADQLVVYVPGISDPYLAGMPVGSTASGYTAGDPGLDSAPGQSPVLGGGSLITPGKVLSFSAIGSVAYGPAPDTGPDFRSSGPSGMLYNGLYIHHLAGPQNGMSDIWTPINALVGVFLNNNQPNPSAIPPTLDFRSTGNVPGGTTYGTLSPALQQVFYIGDGNEGQLVVVPPGATRLFLGVADGYEWANNRGGFTVTLSESLTTTAVVPEPGTLTLLAIGAVGLSGYALRRRGRRSVVDPVF